MIQATTALALLLCLLPTAIHAWPTGAGGCATGVAAPAGFHMGGPAEETSLEDGGFTVTLDSDLMVGETTMITLASSDNKPFRGFLVRLEGDGELEPVGDLGQIAEVCGDVPGVVRSFFRSCYCCLCSIVAVAAMGLCVERA